VSHPGESESDTKDLGSGEEMGCGAKSKHSSVSTEEGAIPVFQLSRRYSLILSGECEGMLKKNHDFFQQAPILIKSYDKDS